MNIFVLTVLLIFKSVEPTCVSDGQTGGRHVNRSVLAGTQVQFTLDQHKKMVNDKDLDGKNIFTSPYSIWEALTLTYLGARGRTSEDLGKVLGYKGLDKTQVDSEFQKIKPKLQSTGVNILKISNRLAFDKRVTLKQCVRTNPLLDVVSVDFYHVPEESSKKLNEWVEDKTMDKIKDLLKPGDITSDTLMVILNAVYFKGTWKTKFKEELTRYRQFTTSSGKQVPVQMMYSSSNYEYIEDAESDILAVKLPYVDEKFKMIMMMPKDPNEAIGELVGRITPQTIDSLLKKMYSGTLQLSVPKLKLEESYKLRKLLEDLGAASIFQSVDMTGFVDSSPPMKVTEVVHKSFIEINEQGSEAAAATGVIYGMRSGKFEQSMVFNRPYIFLIQENETGIILFMGIVRKP